MSDKHQSEVENHFQSVIESSNDETKTMLKAFTEWFFANDAIFSDETIYSEYMTAFDFVQLIMQTTAYQDYLAEIKTTRQGKIITLPNHKTDTD